MKYRGFVHLHLLSHFSIGYSVLRVEDLPNAAAKLGFPAVALTDRWNLFGMMAFEEQAAKAGIRPIFGVEIDLAGPMGVTGVAVLLITGPEGYHNLVRLISAKAGLEAFQSPIQVGGALSSAPGTPVIPIAALASLSSGLAVLTGGNRGLVDAMVRMGRDDLACEVLCAMREAFGPSRAFVEVARFGIPGEGETERRIREIGRRAGLGIVPANDIVMLGRNDLVVRDLLCGLQAGQGSRDAERYLKSLDEMARLFDQEDLDRAVALANECEFLPRSVFGFPAVPVLDLPVGQTPAVFMRSLCEAALSAAYHGKSMKEASERLDMELGVISEKGFEGYFLAVREIVDFCRREGIAVGPGRGSAAGSLTAYLLGITKIDPLVHGLIFERFMNPHRKGLPDIDIDVCARSRPRVLDFVRERFGPERVAQIVAFDHVQDRSAVKMASEYLGVQAETVRAALKGIEDGLSPLAACEAAAAREAVVRGDPKIRETGRVFGELAGSLVGIVRNLSRHAAGLVVSPYDFAARVPVIRTREGLITHFDKDSLDAASLVKMDILALRTLSIIEDTVKSISLAGVECDPSKADLDDPAVYREITSGSRAGLFQIDRPWMDNTISRLKPACFQDLALLLALIRPGPMKGGLMGEFFRRRRARSGGFATTLLRHHSQRETPDPVAEILSETDGMIIYQEQVMLLASKIGGFTMAEADDLRRAMSKKLPEELDALQGRFVKRAEKSGLSKERAVELFQTMAQFAGYGFNKSHSVAYAFITHATAWLKARHLIEFAVACLNSDIGNPAKLEQMVRECNNRGVRTLPPDVNSSGPLFEAVTLPGGERAISFGLSAIRNVGLGLATAIHEERIARDGFSDLAGFFSISFTQGLQKIAAESLAKAGAFDCFGTRGFILGSLSGLLVAGHSKHHGTQLSIFDESSTAASFETPGGINGEPGEVEIANQQREALGFALAADSLSDLGWLIDAADLKVTDRIENLDEGAPVDFLGLVVNHVPGSVEVGRKGEMVLRVDDPCGAVDVRIAPDLWKTVRDEAFEGAVCLFLGHMHNEGGRRMVEASAVLGRQRTLKPETWAARISEEAVEVLGEDGMAALKALMSISDVGVPVYTYIETSCCRVELFLGRIGMDRDTIEAVRDVFGAAFTISPAGQRGEGKS